MSKGYGKPGRPKYKDVRNLKIAKALIETSTEKEAYKKTHPGCTDSSAKINAHRLMSPEVFDMVKHLLAIEKIAEINQKNLEKLYLLVIAKYMQGDEKGANFLHAVDSLAKMRGAFIDHQIVEDITKKSPEEIDLEIKALLQKKEDNAPPIQ